MKKAIKTVFELMRKSKNAYLLYRIVVEKVKEKKAIKQVPIPTDEVDVSDYKSFGMTENEYRSAKRLLEKNGICTFDPKSGIGTTATLLKNDITDNK